MSGNNCPFSSASEYACWTNQNCDRCSKSGDIAVRGSSSCEIFEAIHNAAAGIDIADELAARFGEISGGTGIFTFFGIAGSVRRTDGPQFCIDYRRTSGWQEDWYSSPVK